MSLIPGSFENLLIKPMPNTRVQIVREGQEAVEDEEHMLRILIENLRGDKYHQRVLQNCRAENLRIQKTCSR